jgi:transcriptional regulator with XRE-family HTH domain
LVLNTHNKAPFLRRRLGRRLRAMRESAGLNLDQAAARLDKKRSALHRIETGMTKADVHFVRSAMDIYDEYDANLLDQTREAAKPLWFRAYGVADLATSMSRPLPAESASSRV